MIQYTVKPVLSKHLREGLNACISYNREGPEQTARIHTQAATERVLVRPPECV